MEQSILADVRSACNLERDDDSFDSQLILLTNAQIMMAHQFGVGVDGFGITGEDEIWEDWLGSYGEYLRAVKIWLGLSVLLLFDPPDNGTVLKAYQDTIAKMEWMLREKTEEKGYVKAFVPEKADFYTDPDEGSDEEEYTPDYDDDDEPEYIPEEETEPSDENLEEEY